MESYDLEIVEDLGDGKFIVQATEKEQVKRVGIAHDYVQFTGTTHLTCASGVRVQHSPNHSSNILSINTSVQIPIRPMIHTVLPLLQQADEMSLWHIRNREHTEDSKFGDYKKGDEYAAYAYYTSTVAYWRDGKHLVDVHPTGESQKITMPFKYWNENVKKQ